MSHTFAQWVETKYLVYGACGFMALVILAAILIAPQNALKARGSAPLPMRSLGPRPVLQIELARNEEDLMKIFLPGNSRANLHDAALGNKLDTFLFIPSYTGLLITLGLLLGRFTVLKGRVSLLGTIILLVPVIAICDWSENRGISKAIHHIEAHGAPDAGDAVRVSTPSLIKWTLTMVVLAALGIEAFYTRNWRWSPLAIALVLLSLWIAFILYSYVRERWP